MLKRKFILKNNSLKYWLCFRLFFMADTELTYRDNFVADVKGVNAS